MIDPLAEWRLIHLLCKHFGLTIEYINNEMPVLPDWYCCLSVALDEEEEEAHTRQYLAYISAGGDPKKFPKRKKRATATRKQDTNPFNMVMGAIQKSGLKIPSVRGSVDEYARARGMQKIFKMPDGTFVDEGGNPVEPTPGSVFVSR